MLLMPHAIKKQTIREVAMATAGIVAPEWSEYVGKRKVRHFWSCENCGHEIEMR
jgi:hypothetical protein